MKEQGLCSLWALAGEERLQQLEVANKIGIQMLLELILAKSEKLQYVGTLYFIKYEIFYMKYLLSLNGRYL